ncbi:hypothetical protein BC832DRAFT_595211 [Gaertneriomyces semiglobifer]|nr:hypothetical protein BC832DRAFT_595211 [Gaertneriomyces semiglobifer]
MAAFEQVWKSATTRNAVLDARWKWSFLCLRILKAEGALEAVMKQVGRIRGLMVCCCLENKRWTLHASFLRTILLSTPRLHTLHLLNLTSPLPLYTLFASLKYPAKHAYSLSITSLYVTGIPSNPDLADFLTRTPQLARLKLSYPADSRGMDALAYILDAADDDDDIANGDHDLLARQITHLCMDADRSDGPFRPSFDWESVYEHSCPLTRLESVEISLSPGQNVGIVEGRSCYREAAFVWWVLGGSERLRSVWVCGMEMYRLRWERDDVRDAVALSSLELVAERVKEVRQRGGIVAWDGESSKDVDKLVETGHHETKERKPRGHMEKESTITTWEGHCNKRNIISRSTAVSLTSTEPAAPGPANKYADKYPAQKPESRNAPKDKQKRQSSRRRLRRRKAQSPVPESHITHILPPNGAFQGIFGPSDSDEPVPGEIPKNCPHDSSDCSDNSRLPEEPLDPLASVECPFTPMSDPPPNSLPFPNYDFSGVYFLSLGHFPSWPHVIFPRVNSNTPDNTTMMTSNSSTSDMYWTEL